MQVHHVELCGHGAPTPPWGGCADVADVACQRPTRVRPALPRRPARVVYRTPLDCVSTLGCGGNLWQPEVRVGPYWVDTLPVRLGPYTEDTYADTTADAYTTPAVAKNTLCWKLTSVMANDPTGAVYDHNCSRPLYGTWVSVHEGGAPARPWHGQGAEQ
jgi:hypothetical protein